MSVKVRLYRNFLKKLYLNNKMIMGEIREISPIVILTLKTLLYEINMNYVYVNNIYFAFSRSDRFLHRVGEGIGKSGWNGQHETKRSLVLPKAYAIRREVRLVRSEKAQKKRNYPI